MMQSNFQKPTEAELEILQVLWTAGPATVRKINDALQTKREVGYTTTLKLLQIMAQKNLVEVDKRQRTHIYAASIEQEATQRQLVDQLLDAAFGGSAKKLVMQALGNKKTSQKELDEIKKMIERLEGGTL